MASVAPVARSGFAGKILQFDEVRPDFLRPELQRIVPTIVDEFLEPIVGYGVHVEQEGMYLHILLRRARLTGKRS